MKSTIKLSALALALSASAWANAASNVVLNNDAAGGLDYTTTGSVRATNVHLDTIKGHFDGTLAPSTPSSYNPLNWVRWSWGYFFGSNEAEEISVTFHAGTSTFVGKFNEEDNLIFEASSTDASTKHQITGNGTADITINLSPTA